MDRQNCGGPFFLNSECRLKPACLCFAQRSGRNAFKGDSDRLDQPFLIELHPVNAGHPVIAIGFTQRPAMIHDVVKIFTWYLNDRVMPRAGSNLRILLQYFVDALERPEWRIGHRVGHRIIRPGPAAFRPHEIIFAVSLEHERPLNVALRGDFFESCPIGKCFEAPKIIPKPGDVAVSPAAINQIVLAVRIAERKLIDRLRAIMEAVNQRFAQIILEWPFRLVGHSQADPS